MYTCICIVFDITYVYTYIYIYINKYIYICIYIYIYIYCTCLSRHVILGCAVGRRSGLQARAADRRLGGPFRNHKQRDYVISMSKGIT